MQFSALWLIKNQNAIQKTIVGLLKIPIIWLFFVLYQGEGNEAWDTLRFLAIVVTTFGAIVYVKLDIETNEMLDVQLKKDPENGGTKDSNDSMLMNITSTDNETNREKYSDMGKSPRNFSLSPNRNMGLRKTPDRSRSRSRSPLLKKTPERTQDPPYKAVSNTTNLHSLRP